MKKLTALLGPSLVVGLLANQAPVFAQVCPPTHSPQVYRVQKVGWYSRNGVDIAASTIDQTSYVVARSLGTVPFTMTNERNLYYYQHSTDDHALIADGMINEEIMPVNRTPRIDNWNFLGIVGGWSVAWNALYDGLSLPDIPKVQTRNFAEDMSPASNQISLFQTTFTRMYDALDVAALPGLGKSVVVGSMKSLPSIGSFPTYLQYIEADGSLGATVSLSDTGGQGSGDRFPVVASALTNDDDYVVAAWINAVDGLIRYQIFDSAGNALTTVLTGPAAREIEIGAVPGGFAMVRIEQTSPTVRTVKLATYNWSGTLLSQTSVATGNTIVNPGISATMYPVSGQLQPFFAVTFTKSWPSSNTTMTARYLGMTRGLTAFTVVLPPTAIQTLSGQTFYEPTLTTEYRNSVKLFTGCNNKLVAGVFWNQNMTSGSDTYLTTFNAFVGVSGISSLSPSVSSASLSTFASDGAAFDFGAFEELQDDSDVNAFLSVANYSVGAHEFESSTLLDGKLNEHVPGLPRCYDYLVGSCISD